MATSSSKALKTIKEIHKTLEKYKLEIERRENRTKDIGGKFEKYKNSQLCFLIMEMLSKSFRLLSFTFPPKRFRLKDRQTFQIIQ